MHTQVYSHRIFIFFNITRINCKALSPTKMEKLPELKTCFNATLTHQKNVKL